MICRQCLGLGYGEFLDGASRLVDQFAKRRRRKVAPSASRRGNVAIARGVLVLHGSFIQ